MPQSSSDTQQQLKRIQHNQADQSISQDTIGIMASSSQPPPDRRVIPPACNQCRKRKVRCRREQPVCSNCVKSGLICDFNAQVKRINHTKQLAQDFSQLSGRLERIDETLAKINQRLDKTPSIIYSSSASACTDDYVDRLPADGHDALAITPLQSAVHVHMIDEHGIEHYYGPTSLQALMQRTQASLAGRTSQFRSSIAMSGDTIVQDALNVINQGFPPQQRSLTIKASSSRVVRIPYDLAINALESYLSTNNLVTPLLDADLIRQAVHNYYDIDKTRSNEALNLCMSAMAALTSPGQIAELGSPLSNTFSKLLKNCLGAVDISVLDEARVLNAQALCLLSFVVAEYSTDDLLEQAIKRACRLIRQLGIEHDSGNHEDHSKRAVYWALFALDKQRAFLTGKTCELRLADCDLVVPWTIAESAENAVHAAKAHLFMLYEDIWSALYSARAWRMSLRERQKSVIQLDLKLRTWYERHKDFLNDTKASEPFSQPIVSLKLELQYCFHLAQLLVHRMGSTISNTQTRNNSARAALQIIVSAASRSEQTHVALLKRIIRYNTPLAFFDLHCHQLSGQGSAATNDLELLFHTYIAVQTLAQGGSTDDSYFAHLATSMHWCLSVNKLMVFAAGAGIPQYLDGIPPVIPASYRSREGKRSTAQTAYQDIQLLPMDHSSSQATMADLNWSLDAMTSQYNAFLDINALSINAADMFMVDQADLLQTQTLLQPAVINQVVESESNVGDVPTTTFDREELSELPDEHDDS